MLFNQWCIDNNNLVYKKDLKKITISGMSNKAATSTTNKDLLFPTVYNLLLDFGIMPIISSINQKQAAFNLITGRQCKYQLSIPLFNSILFPSLLIHLNHQKNLNNHYNFGLIKSFYGAHVQFPFNSINSASYFLLPLKI